MFWLLLYALIVLLANLKGYKNCFKSKKRLAEELNISIDKIQKESKMTDSQFKGVYSIVALLYVLFYAAFYIIVWAKSDNLFMTIFSVIMMLILIQNISPLLDAINNRKYKIRWTRYITQPLSTTYILLFVYYIFY